MPTVPESLALAFQQHQAGRLREAELIYRKILDADPKNLDACHLLGVVAYQAGQHQIAIQYLTKAIDLKPDYPEAHYNLANAFFALERFDEAIVAYSRATQLKPSYAEAHNNLGNAYHRVGNLDAAAACYRRAFELRPDHADAHFNLGNILKELNWLPEATASYLHALRLRPDFADAHINLGIVLQTQRQLDTAIACFRQALGLQPENAQAHYCLGLACYELENLHDAITCHRRALEIKPDHADAWNNFGNAQKDADQLEEAIASYLHAVALRPTEHRFHSNLALALQDAGHLDEADASFQRSLNLQPDSAEIRWNRSHLHLLQGDFHRGWREYESRFQAGEVPQRDFRQPVWDGRPLNGQTILLHAEQGFGDTFQFIRYADVAKKLGGRVVVECQRPLAKVLSRGSGIDQLVAGGDDLPDFDVHASLVSVPNILRTDLPTIPANVPYLFADPALVADWRAKLDKVPGVRIGIHWHGRLGRGPFRRRDIPLQCFESLARIPGIRLVSLQKNTAPAELARAEDHPQIIELGDDLDASHGPFMDTAAIMMNLDLVITSDTSIPHLAGALGIPVWLALPFAPDWRWLLNRTDSPWYPTMRLFRQKTRGDWTSVFAEIHSALRELLSAERTKPSVTRPPPSTAYKQT